ncbi:hypothetical protein ABT127_06940 [Streptomyces sp. NPDC001904]|uniref:hypothetical protein n=1 Tax=Streptomyces sp. NPDC001904 TaxID=3154531 RepID=UPI003318F7BF
MTLLTDDGSTVTVQSNKAFTKRTHTYMYSPVRRLSWFTIRARPSELRLTLVSINPVVLQGRNGRRVRDTLGKIRKDFQDETEIELSLYAPDSIPTFKSSIPGTDFTRVR